MSDIGRFLSLNNVSASQEQISLLEAYQNILLEKSAEMNLTAIKDPQESALKNITDSALAAGYLKGKTLLDVGSGAGLPAFPIAILRPDISVTALDATGKKVAFINETAQKLGLSNLKAVCARAEDFAKGENREAFDLVTARAVANMTVLCEICLPFVKIGGRFVALKGPLGEDELNEAKSCISQLGGLPVSSDSVPLLGGEEQTRTIIVVKKVKPTPEAFPRSWAKITKHPMK